MAEQDKKPDENAGRTPISAPATTGDTVTVACKVPNGLVLRAYEMVDGTESSPTGARPIKVAQALPGEFVVRGPAFNARAIRDAESLDAMPVFAGGYALTEGCPRDLWERWLSQNAKSVAVANGLVFACPSTAAARREAGTNRAVKSGLEPLNVDDAEETRRRLGLSRRVETLDAA